MTDYLICEFCYERVFNIEKNKVLKAHFRSEKLHNFVICYECFDILRDEIQHNGFALK